MAALAIVAPAAGQENPAATPVSRRPTTSILSIQGTRFLLDGKPFYFQGLSFFNALYNKEFNKSPESREKTLRRFKSYGITALRIWGDWRLTNGWIDDLRRFAAVLGDRQFSPEVRVLVTPATQKTYRQAMEEGILAKIVDAGGAVGIPACGPCLGAQGGLLGAGEICLSTSNRNFRGRMGHLESRVYLASPAVAAATAVTGRITHPCEVAGSNCPR